MSDKIQIIENLSIGFKSKSGNEVSILKDISTHINKGETVGIVGESGSGKSTLALAMMGYTKQGLFTISGQCLFKSKNLLNMTDRDLEKIRGKEIAMIPQNAGQSLTPNLRIGYQIEETLKLHSKIDIKDRQLKITELLNKVRLPSPNVIAQRYPHELSGGQQQRPLETAGGLFSPEDGRGDPFGDQESRQQLPQHRRLRRSFGKASTGCTTSSKLVWLQQRDPGGARLRIPGQLHPVVLYGLACCAGTFTRSF